MPPSTRSLRSLRSRRTASPTSTGEESEVKPDSSEPILQPGSTSGSDDQTDPKKKSRVTFSQDTMVPPSPSISDASSSMKRAVSARAQRSLRRQAKIEKDPVQKGCSTGNKFSIMKPRRRIDKNDQQANSSMNSTTIMRKGPSGKEEEVVKVKLNTGTLYLYKGVNRRAVFVRRI